MYLQSLELFGFKSFAPKTKLEFHRGVTAVVGPNGCGKSNVLDAIRWVLGEQSAKALRGGEMADVIFSGTDSRAAVGMAEVSMTFAECEEQLGLDWHEVTITRRVFRDGGSEYLLNRTPCRLRDIQQLFMDTGIGRSAYSIMEQGKIDMILSSRPEDRRAIFEEAAGITKYKAQKREALRKLEATEANLLRLADIIKEVKRQIGSLQRQAGKARRYQALLADLKLLETHSAKRQFDVLEQQRVDAAAEIAQLGDSQIECEQEIDRQESETSVQRAALDQMEQRLQGARQAVNDLKARIASHQNRISFNDERAAEFRSLVERYRIDVAGADEKLRIAQEQLQHTDSELEQITTLLAAELRRMEEKQAAVADLSERRRNSELALNQMQAEYGRLESRISGLRGQIASITQQRDGAEARLGIVCGELQQLELSFTHFSEQKTATQAELERVSTDLEARSADLASAEVALRERQGALVEIDRELRDAQKALAEKDSKLEVLRQLNAGGEGFSEGTQAILRGLDNPEFFKPAVLGAIAQFIEVPPEFVAAVEAALAANLQTIVMKDAMVAESVVKTLTHQKLGRASLAVREFDRIFEHVENAELALPDGAIDWLINKVKAQPDVARLVERLINHTVLVPDLATALRIFPQRGSAIVTLSGELLSGNGILHGGATNEATNSILQRKNQISALEGEAHEMRNVLQGITSRRDALLLDIDAASARVHETREQKQNAAVAVSSLRGELAMLDREARETERKQQTLGGERASAEQRHREAADRIISFESEVQNAVAQTETLQGQRGELQTLVTTLRAQESDLSADLNELKIKVATERQRHTSLHHQRAPMEARLMELAELIAQRRADIESYEQRAEVTAAENVEIEANLRVLRGETADAEKAVAALVAERAAIAATLEEMSNTLRILRHQLSECHDQRSRLEVKQTQLEMRANALQEHVQKRYQLDLTNFERDLHGLRVAVREQGKRISATAASSSNENSPATDTESAVPASDEADAPPGQESFDLDWTQIEAMVRELDQRIDAMGPVNIDAIVEYDELEERHVFLEKQNTDLANSKAELLEVISKINHTTRQLFADTFEQVRVNFQEMFTELFGGGKANLVLVDESDPLESGIEIIAKPPGKQLQSISLLSGGEKTMTAVSLLFSIYMVKPSPFCVLDEMDAPLDESNINRFIRILDRFVAQSQFVVISHNKRTIARADALYGVTMEEQGVSKLVGVRFTKRDESAAGSDIMGTRNPAPVPSVAETFGKTGALHSEQLQAV